MPALSEFRLTLQLRHEEAEGKTLTCFRFETTREFQTFSYEIDVNDTIDQEKREIHFALEGVTAPTQSLAVTGPAAKEICYPQLEGSWKIRVAGAKEDAQFEIRATPKRNRLVQEPERNTIELRLIDEVEVIRG